MAANILSGPAGGSRSLAAPSYTGPNMTAPEPSTPEPTGSPRGPRRAGAGRAGCRWRFSSSAPSCSSRSASTAIVSFYKLRMYHHDLTEFVAMHYAQGAAALLAHLSAVRGAVAAGRDLAHRRRRLPVRRRRRRHSRRARGDRRRLPAVPGGEDLARRLSARPCRSMAGQGRARLCRESVELYAGAAAGSRGSVLHRQPHSGLSRRAVACLRHHHLHRHHPGDGDLRHRRRRPGQRAEKQRDAELARPASPWRSSWRLFGLALLAALPIVVKYWRRRRAPRDRDARADARHLRHRRRLGRACRSPRVRRSWAPKRC